MLSYISLDQSIGLENLFELNLGVQRSCALCSLYSCRKHIVYACAYVRVAVVMGASGSKTKAKAKGRELSAESSATPEMTGEQQETVPVLTRSVVAKRDDLREGEYVKRQD